MAYDGLNWQTINLPFAAGLNQKTDVRARPQPFLDICRDVQFDELGGLQARLPFGVMSNSIFGGGTLTNCRRIEVVNDELVVFTDASLYSWSVKLSAWVLRGTHLAVSVSETSRFVTTDDQINPDRAELSGAVVFTWSGSSTKVYVAALDKATGAVIMAATAISGTATRPRVVALSTKILFTYQDGSSNLKAIAIDPAAPATSIAGGATTILATNANSFYDVVRVPGADTAIVACRRTTTTSYSILKVTSALAVTAATPGRTCDGPIAVAVDPTGADLQIIRGNSTNIQGDLVAVSNLADVHTGESIGTGTSPINQIAVEYSSVKVGGQYVATAIWSSGETDGSSGFGFASKVNTVDQAATIGTQATFVSLLGVASRAFEYNGSIYVWMVFAGTANAGGIAGTVGVRAQLQNTYFLYRADGLLVAKSTDEVAGGFSPSTGHLPGVALTGTATYSWCATERQIIPLGTSTDNAPQTGYAARAPRDCTFSFDSNEARRAARIGRTLYIGGGVLLQYDGLGLTEVGFQIYPWAIQAAPLSGSIALGTYTYKATLGWQNAQGEKERSTTAVGASVTVSGSTAKEALDAAELTVTRKTTAMGFTAPAFEFWRTVAAAGVGAPFYLVTSKDPSTVGTDNGYIANDQTGTFLGGSFNDNLTDAVLTTKEANPENGSVLENLAPPAASLIIATDTRVFLAGVPGDPDRVWPSKLRNAGEIAAWHDSLPFAVPRPGGDITALWFDDNGVLYVSRETAIYAFAGPGQDNTGSGSAFTMMRVVSDDIGAISQETVARTPQGQIIKTSKGWYLVTGSGDVEYIGDKVSGFDGDTVYAVHVVETQHQVRILTSARMIVWDYLVNQWGEWTISDGVHATIWNGTHVYLTATGPKQQQTTYAGINYGIDVETAWIKLADLQGAAKVRALQPLGEYRGAHKLRFRVAYSYQQSDSGGPGYLDDKSWTPSPTAVGGPLQVKHGPKRPKCESIKLRLTAENADGTHTAPTTEALKLTSLALEVGLIPGLNRQLPAAQRQ